MGCNMCKNSETTPETESAIGEEFAFKYFDALTTKPDAAGLDRFYNNRSEYVLQESGQQPALMTKGVDEIIRFMVEMNHHKCMVIVESVNTVNVHSNWFFVSVVGKLVHFGQQLPRPFFQSTIFKYTSSSSSSLSDRRFRIKKTLFEFHDVIVDGIVLEPVNEPNIFLIAGHLYRAKGPIEDNVTGHSNTFKHTPIESTNNCAVVENTKKCIDTAVAPDKPKACTEKPATGWQKSIIVGEHVPEELFENGIEYPKQLIDNTTASTESNVENNPTEQKPFHVLKHALEQSIKNHSVEDRKRHVNTAIIVPSESRQMRKKTTKQQSAVLKHILELSINEPRTDDKEQANGVEKSVDLKIEENTTKEKQCSVAVECTKSSDEESCDAYVKNRIADSELLCNAENISKAFVQKVKQKRTNTSGPVSAASVYKDSTETTDVGPAKDSQAPPPVQCTNALYDGALS